MTRSSLMDDDHQLRVAKQRDGRVSFARRYHLSSSPTKRISAASRHEANPVKRLTKGKSPLINHADISELPVQDIKAITANEPSLDFLQLQICGLPVPPTGLIWENELNLKEQETEVKVDGDDDGSNHIDGFQTRIQEPVLSYSTENYIPRLKNLRVFSHYVKAWLRGASITDLTMEFKQKRRDLQRAKSAQVHAALSVAAVAIAVASMASNSRSSGGGAAARDSALASAASLVAAASAEVAQSTGANRAVLASLVDAAVNLHSPSDILKFTASATSYMSCIGCGAHSGRKRSRNNLAQHLQAQTSGCNEKDMQESAIDPAALSRGTDLFVRFDAGKNIQLRNVSFYVNHDHLVVVRLTKKHFGVFTTSKEYEVADAPIKDEEKGLLYLKVKTKGGSIASILFRM